MAQPVIVFDMIIMSGQLTYLQRLMRVYVLMRVSCHMLCVFVLKNTPQQTTMLILLSRQISKGD